MGENLDLAGLDIFVGYTEPLDTERMIRMTVGVDNRLDRLVGDLAELRHDFGGELIVLAPGLAQFGEDPDIDKLIRKYGYVGTEKILKLVKEKDDLEQNLSAAAHLIHGSSEGRFKIIYCPGNLSKEQIKSVNFSYADLEEMMAKYNPVNLNDGFNTIDGEEIYYISNPGLGLWSWKQRFESQ